MEEYIGLIKKAQARDADSFTKLMTNHMQLMYKLARTVLENNEDIADAVSDTILCCWENIGELKHAKGFRAWLSKIVINKCNDMLRKKRDMLSYEEYESLEGREDEELLNVEWNEIIDALDKKYRQVIVLYYVEGFRTKEIAHILGIPEASVRTRLARARKILREVL